MTNHNFKPSKTWLIVFVMFCICVVFGATNLDCVCYILIQPPFVMLHKTCHANKLVLMVSKDDWALTIQSIKDQCRSVTKGFIKNLKRHFTMRTRICRNHTSFQLKFKKQFIYNYCATIPWVLQLLCNYPPRNMVY
jgi:hypothetical protein